MPDEVINSYTCSPRLQPAFNGRVVLVARELDIGPDAADSLPNVTDMDNLEAVLDLYRQVLDILAILRRQQNRLDTRP